MFLRLIIATFRHIFYLFLGKYLLRNDEYRASLLPQLLRGICRENNDFVICLTILISFLSNRQRDDVSALMLFVIIRERRK